MATSLLQALEPAGFDDVLTGVDKAELDDGGPIPALQPPAGSAPGAGDSSIAAYYSLVFPNLTYYLQTLTVTIGRRMGNGNNETLGEGSAPVDVDLGQVKSVSRRHAQITYDDDDECWVLDVFGRNGAWVDDNWFGPSARVPLQSK